MYREIAQDILLPNGFAHQNFFTIHIKMVNNGYIQNQTSDQSDQSDLLKIHSDSNLHEKLCIQNQIQICLLASEKKSDFMGRIL